MRSCCKGRRCNAAIAEKLAIGTYLEKVNDELSRLYRITLILHLDGVPRELLPSLSAQLLRTLNTLTKEPSMPLSTLKHVWEVIPTLNSNNGHALSRAIYSLVEASISHRPYQLGHDVEVPLSLLHCMLSSQFRSSRLTFLVMDTIQKAAFYRYEPAAPTKVR